MSGQDTILGQWMISDAHALAAVQELGPTPIYTDRDHYLWTFKDGVWRPTGDTEVQNRLVALSGGTINNGKISSVIQMARRMPIEFDRDQAARHSFETLRINARNTTIDLRTTTPEQGVVAIDHDPADMFTSMVPHDWNPSAQCPRIDDFLYSLWDGDEEMIQFAYKVMGYCLLPGLRLKKAFLFYSPHENSGKSLMQGLIRRLVGDPDNCATISLVGMDNKRFDTANLRGKMVATGPDLADQAPITSSMFKSLTGADVVDAEEKGVQGFQLYNYATFIFSSNYYPPTAEPSSAYFSRWFVVPFPNQFTPTPNFEVPLFVESELEGLMVKAVNAAHQLLHDDGWGKVPQPVLDATKMYEFEGNTVLQFIETSVDFDENSEVKGMALYDQYVRWVGGHGNGALSTKRFYGQLRSMNKNGRPVSLVRTREGQMVRGIRFRATSKPSWVR